VTITIGFSGTQHGMSPDQRETVRNLLSTYYLMGGTKFVHGNCIGADEEAAEMAMEMGYYVFAHIAATGNKQSERNTFHDCSEVPLPPLTRNRLIVNESTRMIIAPYRDTEHIRSGTWATYRYAHKQNRPIAIVRRDGEWVIA
jgi:predicted Rossmann fold nucleotide-binding protein DprA/Smf involved in DNA uptake